MRKLPADIAIRHEPRPGDIGYLLYLHGTLYADEYGLDCTFEAGMAGPLAKFATNLSERNRLWLIDYQDRLAGSIAVDGKSEDDAELRWLLLHPSLRGNGMGRFLVEEALQFCEEKEYERVFLWTIEKLEAAKKLYRSVGFEITDENTENRWEKVVTMQRYELELT